MLVVADDTRGGSSPELEQQVGTGEGQGRLLVGAQRRQQRAGRGRALVDGNVVRPTVAVPATHHRQSNGPARMTGKRTSIQDGREAWCTGEEHEHAKQKHFNGAELRLPAARRHFRVPNGNQHGGEGDGHVGVYGAGGHVVAAAPVVRVQSRISGAGKHAPARLPAREVLFEAEKGRSSTGVNAACVEYFIATTCMALNRRAVFSSCCQYILNPDTLGFRTHGIKEERENHFSTAKLEEVRTNPPHVIPSEVVCRRCSSVGQSCYAEVLSLTTTRRAAKIQYRPRAHGPEVRTTRVRDKTTFLKGHFGTGEIPAADPKRSLLMPCSTDIVPNPRSNYPSSKPRSGLILWLVPRPSENRYYIFQQDGCHVHLHHEIRLHLNNAPHRRWIGRAYEDDGHRKITAPHTVFHQIQGVRPTVAAKFCRSERADRRSGGHYLQARVDASVARPRLPCGCMLSHPGSIGWIQKSVKKRRIYVLQAEECAAGVRKALWRPETAKCAGEVREGGRGCLLTCVLQRMSPSRLECCALAAVPRREAEVG
ncbi:hypothetical protein PR048_017811 [Dryococelus australis]|uniref:Uncharacterized protein n=1 Tax=Dryococelus australis TaxID=614101 RepID=A0ABQ9HAN7_9NEOP|nr:hypothetical protein PR048_017811 [Dryococelus australis]